MILDRRRFIVSGALGALMLALPVWAQFGRGFTLGVASGEPNQHSILLWTGIVSENGARLTAGPSETPDFARIVAGGNVPRRSPARLHRQANGRALSKQTAAQ